MKRDDAHHVLRRPMKQAAAAACCAGNGEDSTFPPGLRKVWGETRGCNITTLCFLRPSSLTLLCLIYTAVSHSLPLLNHSLILPLRALTSPSSYLPYPSLSLFSSNSTFLPTLSISHFSELNSLSSFHVLNKAKQGIQIRLLYCRTHRQNMCN